MTDVVGSIVADPTGFEREVVARAGEDAAFGDFARSVEVEFAIQGDGWVISVEVSNGDVRVGTSAPRFTLRAADDTWRSLLVTIPDPGNQSVLAALKTGRAALVGDQLSFAQHIQLVRRLIEIIRHDQSVGGEKIGRALTLRGSYVRIDVPAWGTCDVFVERTGTGPPLVCLATAGSDTRQYHGLVTLTDVASRYEIIAFDLPWHGKSDPGWGMRPTHYVLDSESYVSTIVALVQALDLPERPILVGSSMAGAAVVEAVALHPELFRGAIASQAGPRVAGRRTAELRSPVVNQTLHIPEWTYGLMSPHSPAGLRDLVWWGYSQGGFGVYDSDIAYYSHSWHIENVRHLLLPSSPHIVVMSGEYDTSVPPAASAELAAAIPNSSFRVMPELGHFPHAENPRAFAPHLEWAISRILDAAPTEGLHT